MKKKIIMMATVVALALVGCGEKETEVTDGIAQESQEDNQDEIQEEGTTETEDSLTSENQEESVEDNLVNGGTEDGKAEEDTTGTIEETNKEESNQEEKPEANQAESGKTEAGKTESNETGSGKTEVNKTEVNKNDSNKTDSNKTETTKPSTSKPSNKPTTKPETTVKPEPTKPTTKPEASKPTTKPETKPETTKPETTKPTTKPETSKPTTKPETTKPETKPEVTPEIKPEVEVVDHMAKMAEIESEVSKGYEYYIPSMSFNETYFTEVLRVQPEWYDAALGKGPLMSAHVDTFVAIHPTEGNLENVVAGLESYKDYLINDSFQYPSNMMKVREAAIEVIGDYVYFIMLGSVDMNITEEDELLSAFQAQNEIALEIIRNYK